MADMAPAPQRGASSWYRSDQERAKSLRRRANPWYRRIGRFFVGAAFLAGAGLGLYVGAREVQDYLERERLPAQGAELPTIRSTSFQVRSSAPAPPLDGTLTLDTSTRAYEFVGRIDGPDQGWQVVSPDGQTVWVRRSSGPWRPGSGEEIVARIGIVVQYLADDDSADDILTSHLRRGFVELERREFEGLDDDRLTRYEMTFNTLGFSTRFPLQWQDFKQHAIPGIDEARSVPVFIWLDDDDVLVRVRDEGTNWAWERLAYDDQPFRPTDPSGTVVEVTSGFVEGDGADQP